VSRFTRTGWQLVPVPKMLLEQLPNIKGYQKNVEDGHLSVLVGPEPYGFHMSISHRTDDLKPGRYPTWDEITEARYEFCPSQMTMVMFLPPKEEYVNVHETTFHLWELES
jgi:hypothetical protein